jgi:hypothetical protein
MSARTELAERFMAALLARDPLPAQRFTEIDARLQQLAHIAQKCAVTFLTVDAQWEQSAEQANAIARRIWDYACIEVAEISTPSKLKGAATRAMQDADLFGANAQS